MAFQVARQFLNPTVHHPPLSRSASFKTSNTQRHSTVSADLAALDKLVSALLGTQSRDSPIPNRLNMHQNKSFKSKRASTLSNASSIGLATIMEAGNCDNRESQGTERSTSWSEKVFNHPVVSNALGNLKPESRMNIQAHDPLINPETGTDIEYEDARDVQK